VDEHLGQSGRAVELAGGNSRLLSTFVEFARGCPYVLSPSGIRSSMQAPRFLAALFSSAPGNGSGRAERPLRWLVAGSLVLPVAIFAIASAIAYRQTLLEARDRLDRNLNTAYEHALKVFETFDLSSRYLDEMIGDASDEQIRASEAQYHARLKVLTDVLPQLADLWVIDADGHPLVSGTVFPMPRLDLADRHYFSVHKGSQSDGVYVGEVVRARTVNAQGQPRFFALSRKRLGPNGQFAGVTTISISPGYFVDYYSGLPPPGIAALIRADGAVLARFPDPPRQVERLPEQGLFMRTVRERPDRGFVELPASSFDNQSRLYVYRKLPNLGVYVVTGVDKSAITELWMTGMAKHLIFGIPATLAMFGLGMMALRRTRREGVAHQQLRAEVARREQTEQALRQSQKLEAVGRLTGGIAHDFNNLLTAILGHLDLAMRRLSPGNERVAHSLQVAHEASERAATLVNRLLAFSRQHPLEVKAVDLNRLVQGMSELLRRAIGETLTVETVLGAGIWKVAIDPNQLENAILNLVVNARDAMPNGGRLTIETTNSYLDEAYVVQAGGDLAHGQYVLLAVSDTGTGMSKELIERAFEPFFTTKPTGIGSGLGLSMVYGFVKQSGGHIRIYSEIGEGTTVKIYFPRLSAQTSVPDWAEQQDVLPQGSDPDGEETVLLVEDDAQVNRFATEVLRDRGYRVIAAPDGPTALQLLENESDVALLFTDVVLPGGMNGRQLADEVRRRRPDIKVLFATGYTRNAIIHQGRLDPGVELLNKPFTASTLLRKVRQILDGGDTTPPRASESIH
jgi:two-component system, NtrC family, sensor kinase